MSDANHRKRAPSFHCPLTKCYLFDSINVQVYKVIGFAGLKILYISLTNLLSCTGSLAKAVSKSLTVIPTSVRTISATPSPRQRETDLSRQQGAARPLSPHILIYEPQLTWYMSGAHRITGTALAGGFYVGTLAYLFGPAFGLHLDSASLVSAIATLPVSAKIGAKTLVAFPFVYHSLNGVRHLIWDMGMALTLKGVYATGYMVLGGTVVGSLYLASL
ncbi:hypothetical protein BC938DRAFT_475591 [Jimgerdemannia flammicorona]|uniref:Succinate dehydrogenase cytochrome b560 subunit n=1 Tax=Jimgerdemannia flammicorona TaxID=994334 RepID=A0A433PRT6_9FUNG|nr:hypothetical protein BC938DRAFT_475591 [Jimgerdemannia flammicorona]